MLLFPGRLWRVSWAFCKLPSQPRFPSYWQRTAISFHFYSPCVCHGPREKLTQTQLWEEVNRKSPSWWWCRNEHVPRWRDRRGLAAGEVGEVCSTSSPLRVKPSHTGGEQEDGGPLVQSHWASSPQSPSLPAPGGTAHPCGWRRLRWGSQSEGTWLTGAEKTTLPLQVPRIQGTQSFSKIP